ncbi:MAG: o-succinylbenzoate synthase [Leptolyngbya sp. BL-A-14]
MVYRWQFQPYRRRFKQALQTRYGLWSLREGVILRLVNDAGKVGWGEIAPIPWFGSETLEQALAFCRQLPSELSERLIFTIPDSLPSCQFAFESAWEAMKAGAIERMEPQRRRGTENQNALVTEVLIHRTQSSGMSAQNSERPWQNSTLDGHPPPNPQPTTSNPLSYSVLLPTGETALSAWKPLWEKGFRTFKWKIGVQAITAEHELLRLLMQQFPPSARLRLDANGGLSIDDAARWLETCDAIAVNPKRPVTLEYLEQPLDVSQFQAMQDLNRSYRTPIALDESVATLQQLQTCYESGWRGIFVIKPAIVGSPMRLRQFCQAHPIDAVFSSAFETAIGRQAGLRLAAALGNPERAMGYGTNHWVEEAESSSGEPLWQTPSSA